MNKEDTSARFEGWTRCGNCKQCFQGALNLQINRRFWRRHRSNHNVGKRYDSTRSLVTCLGFNGELDVAKQLLDEASTFVGNDLEALLDLKLFKAIMLTTNGEQLEALGLLQAMLPQAKAYAENPFFYTQAMLHLAHVLFDLHLYQKSHEAAAELILFTREKFGGDDPLTLKAKSRYASASAGLGRLEEAKANFEDVLTTQTRVFGRDHPDTQHTIDVMRTYGFGEPSGL